MSTQQVGSPHDPGMQIFRDLEKFNEMQSEADVSDLFSVLEQLTKAQPNIQSERTLDLLLGRLSTVSDCLCQLNRRSPSEKLSELSSKVEKCRGELGVNKKLANLSTPLHVDKFTRATQEPKREAGHRSAHEGDLKANDSNLSSSEKLLLPIDLKTLLDRVRSGDLRDNKQAEESALLAAMKFLSRYSNFKDIPPEHKFIVDFVESLRGGYLARLEYLKRNNLAEGIWLCEMISKCRYDFISQIDSVSDLLAMVKEVEIVNARLRALNEISRHQPPLNITEEGQVKIITTHLLNHRAGIFVRLDAADPKWKKENAKIEDIDKILTKLEKMGEADLNVTEEGHLGFLYSQVANRHDEMVGEMADDDQGLYIANRAIDREYSPKFKEIRTQLKDFQDRKKDFSNLFVKDLLLALDQDARLKFPSKLLLSEFKDLKRILEEIFYEDIDRILLEAAKDLVDYMSECEQRILDLEKRLKISEEDRKEEAATFNPGSRMKVSNHMIYQLSSLVRKCGSELKSNHSHSGFIDRATARMEALLSALNTADLSKLKVSGFDVREMIRTVGVLETSNELSKKKEESYRHKYVIILSNARILSTKLKIEREKEDSGSDSDFEDPDGTIRAKHTGRGIRWVSRKKAGEQ